MTDNQFKMWREKKKNKKHDAPTMYKRNAGRIAKIEYFASV
jgi:hypothetical protein